MVQTGNHMTMSILRRISVEDIDLCPLQRDQNTECASHANKEYKVCLVRRHSRSQFLKVIIDHWLHQGVLGALPYRMGSEQ